MSIFEPEWYTKVFHACAYDTDIETLSEGDSTKVGSAGTALSGGQMLRIVRWVFLTMSLLLLTLDRHLLEPFIPDNRS